MIRLKNPFILGAVIFLSYMLAPSGSRAQDSITVYFTKTWKRTTGDSAYFYRKAWKTGKDGLWGVRDYYPTHILQMSGFTYDPQTDSCEGHTVYYYPGGQRKSEGNYIHNKHTGFWQQWYENGTLSEAGNYKDNEATGEWKSWHENGKLAGQGTYDQDSLSGEWKRWHENGQLGMAGSYINGKETGEWSRWYENGQLQSKGNFINGEQVGEWRYWHENGKLSFTGSLDEGYATGLWKAWYENGNKDYEAYYHNGKLDSTGTWYYENGQRSAEEFYANDILISGKYWDEQGKTVSPKDARDRQPCFVDETNTAVLKYVSAHVNYPKEARQKNIAGKVEVKFMVDTDGSITDAEVTRSADPLLDAEALRVVSNMPKWIPGRQHNRPAQLYFTLPVNFRLQ